MDIIYVLYVLLCVYAARSIYVAALNSPKRPPSLKIITKPAGK